MSSFDDFVKNNTTWLDNEYVAGALTIFLIVYASLAAPKLPNYIAKLFDYTLFKVVIFFLIVYIHKKNPTVALIAAIALMVSLMTLDKLKLTESMTAGSPASEKYNNDINFSDLNDLINNALDYVTTPEAQAVVEQTQVAVEAGQLHPAEAEMIIRKIINSESTGKPVLVAMSEEGAQQMSSVAEAVAQGEMRQEEGRMAAAQIVVQENMMRARDQESVMISQEAIPAPSQEKQMLSQEVAKRKQEIEENTGSRMTKIQLKQLCMQIEKDYRNQKVKEMSDLSGLDNYDNYDNYASFY
jgi:hypothetical protein